MNAASILLAAHQPSFGDDAVRYVAVLLFVMGVAGGLLLIIAAVKGTLWPNYRTIIQRWCRQHDLEFIHLERRHFRTGPYIFSFGATAVFYVTARDASGKENHLWVRYGNWMFGTLFSSLQVREAD